MSNAGTVQRNFDSWNRHDATALVATFARGSVWGRASRAEAALVGPSPSSSLQPTDR